jgi:hypothetical protein
MLKLTSRFVLEVLPYLLSALVAAVLVPGFVYSLITVTLPGIVYSKPHEMEAMVTPSGFGRGENSLGLIRWDHEAVVSDQLLRGLVKTAETNQVNR